MKVLLGSRSPRRRELLKQMGIDFTPVDIEMDEVFEGVKPEDVAEYLAVEKSTTYGDLREGELLITSDTTVVIHNKVLNKPADKAEAMRMLQEIAGTDHEVISGVCLRTKDEIISFSELTKVFMADMSLEEICYYIDHYKPFDKAGSYGIQEWIGLAKVKKIDGCYYNVMGLPCAALYETLKDNYPQLLPSV